MKRPEFTVIAGPNGAGKSRLCSYYIHTQHFDGDLLALNLQKEHPDWKREWITGSVAGELEKQKNKALSGHCDFAFETNFSNDLILNMIDEFKNAGFKISLLYFGLGSLAESFIRVDQRKMYGGHNVEKTVIEHNFKEGILRIQQNLHLFDNLTFIDGNSMFGEIVALHIKKSGKHEITNHASPWFSQYFKAAFEQLVY